jgi:uncharacterized protein (UPF0335 family)
MNSVRNIINPRTAGNTELIDFISRIKKVDKEKINGSKSEIYSSKGRRKEEKALKKLIQFGSIN